MTDRITAREIASTLEKEIEPPGQRLSERTLAEVAERAGEGRRRSWLPALAAVLLAAAVVATFSLGREAFLTRSHSVGTPGARSTAVPTPLASQQPSAQPTTEPSPVSTPPPTAALGLRPGLGFDGWFVTPDSGWIVAKGNTSTSLLRTTDAGAHWSSQRQWPGGTVVRLHFLDASSGFVAFQAGGQGGWALERTLDGGGRWTRVPLPAAAGQFKHLDFVSRDEGWVATQDPVSLHHTTDAGAHWENLTAGQLGGPFINGFRFDSPIRGWAFHWTNWNTIQTLDGGRTWGFVQLPQIPGESASQTGLAVFFDGNSGVLPCTTGNSVYLYRSNDGGRTWTSPVKVPNVNTVNLAPVSPEVWFAMTGTVGSPVPTGVEVTLDGGRSWLHRPANLTGDTRLTGLDFVSPSHGWATTLGSAGPGLVRTTDGGQTWAEVRLPPQP